MRIENNFKLDFDSVLIKPKRSTLKSRSDVQLSRSFIFKYFLSSWNVVPIIASNMDVFGTFKMMEAWNKFIILTILRKYYKLDKLEETIT